MSDKQRILIADDSEMNRAILTEMLGEEYEILEAENGQQAIEMIEKNSGIDLLLLDIMMPVKDGFDVLTAMNQYHWIDELPVIMISAENATSFVERAYNLGATDYISRPFDMAVVQPPCGQHPDAVRQAEAPDAAGGRPDLRKRKIQLADDYHPQPYCRVPQWRERHARAAHPHLHRDDPAQASSR